MTYETERARMIADLEQVKANPKSQAEADFAQIMLSSIVPMLDFLDPSTTDDAAVLAERMNTAMKAMSVVIVTIGKWTGGEAGKDRQQQVLNALLRLLRDYVIAGLVLEPKASEPDLFAGD
jgi:predicted xylose isomerase-like sugar epimerase